jgi:Na+-transporting methylmalonyl-CoA/oxaloacetate decarboxylase gamma subunit
METEIMMFIICFLSLCLIVISTMAITAWKESQEAKAEAKAKKEAKAAEEASEKARQKQVEQFNRDAMDYAAGLLHKLADYDFQKDNAAGRESSNYDKDKEKRVSIP